MANYQTSVIIPVLNNWDLTRACLKSLAGTLPENVEIIVADNGSADLTPQFCAALGGQIFGSRFRYVRFRENRNFGPACNLAAQMAQGDFLLFLNNDTEALPGFYEPLLEDFASIANLGCTGPMLLYPDVEPLGRTVQHLGVSVTPGRRLMHLYEGIPAASPLARKRRFFQAITAACLFMPRQLFLDMGMYDPAYVNGFEDVDLCLRLCQRGYRITINPTGQVIHYQGQTEGRHDQDAANSHRFWERCRQFLRPDWHEFVLADEMLPGVNNWLELQPRLPRRLRDELAGRCRGAGREELGAMIRDNPWYEPAWAAAAGSFDKLEPRLKFSSLWRLAFRGVWPLMDVCEATLAVGDVHESTARFYAMCDYCRPLRGYEEECARKLDEARGIASMEAAYARWRENLPHMARNIYAPFMRRFWEIALEKRLTLYPQSSWAYPAWICNVDKPRRERRLAGVASATGISILMPVYNPAPAHLREALESVIAQSHTAWELCIADDASTAPEIRPILEEYCARDKRIKVTYRRENGHIAAATNTALTMATCNYSALMDQDDLLTPDALALVAAAIEERPDAMLIYSDEDKLHELGEFCNPYFKNNAWDWQLLTTQNFVSHLGVYRTDRLRDIGGFRDGFPGAQDYDLLLRYVSGLPESAFIHIPHVLYHWRVHDGSTAKTLRAKPEAVVSSVKALEDWVADHCPGAEVKYVHGLSFQRLLLPLPEPLPSIAIICDAHGLPDSPPLEEQFFSSWRNTALPHEFILVLSEKQRAQMGNVATPSHWRIMVSDLPLAARWNWAVKQTGAQALGLVTGNLVPLRHDWLREAISALWRPGIGALGGRLRQPGKDENEMADSGWLALADGRLAPILANTPWDKSRYFGWNRLSRTVLSVNGACVFTRTELWRKLNGCREELEAAPLEDYCIRLTDAGSHVIWWPYAQFALRKAIPAPQRDAALREINDHWQGHFRPCSENLLLKNGELSLCPAP